METKGIALNTIEIPLTLQVNSYSLFQVDTNNKSTLPSISKDNEIDLPKKDMKQLQNHVEYKQNDSVELYTGEAHNSKSTKDQKSVNS